MAGVCGIRNIGKGSQALVVVGTKLDPVTHKTKLVVTRNIVRSNAKYLAKMYRMTQVEPATKNPRSTVSCKIIYLAREASELPSSVLHLARHIQTVVQPDWTFYHDIILFYDEAGFRAKHPVGYVTRTGFGPTGKPKLRGPDYTFGQFVPIGDEVMLA
jgi:hypothetical protein